MASTYGKIADVLVSHLGLDPGLIHPQATFAELDVDSLAMSELAVMLEDEYGISLDQLDPSETLAMAAAHLDGLVTTSDRAHDPVEPRSGTAQS